MGTYYIVQWNLDKSYSRNFSSILAAQPHNQNLANSLTSHNHKSVKSQLTLFYSTSVHDIILANKYIAYYRYHEKPAIC